MVPIRGASARLVTPARRSALTPKLPKCGPPLKKLLLSLAALLVLCATQSAKADTLTFTPTPVDLNDLDHHMVYTWKVSNVNLPQGQSIVGARITLKNIANWDNNANKLFIHLLDNAKYSGVASFTDDPNSGNTSVSMIDDFVDTRYHNQSNWLVANGTADTLLHTYVNLPTTPQTLIYNFSASELTALFSYISNGGDFALGFDPDCHFFNDGIKFEIFTGSPTPNSPTPEPATIALLGTGLAGLYARRRRKANRAA